MFSSLVVMPKKTWQMCLNLKQSGQKNWIKFEREEVCDVHD